MPNAKVIRPSKSPWASPVVLIPKSDGSIRFCVDYRRLKAVTRSDSYPLPRLNECLDSLGAAQWFTALDADCGYWQIPVHPKDVPMTAFTCHKGLSEYT